MAKKRGQVSLTRRKETSIPVTSTRESILQQQSDLTPKPENTKSTKSRLAAYVNEELPLRLTLAQVKLQQLTGLRGHAVSQSAIVEASLELVLEALDTQGKSSQLAQRLMEKNSDM